MFPKADGKVFSGVASQHERSGLKTSAGLHVLCVLTGAAEALEVQERK